jgi:hypothetical protein
MLPTKEEYQVILSGTATGICSILLHTDVPGWILSVNHRTKIKYFCVDWRGQMKSKTMGIDLLKFNATDEISVKILNVVPSIF